MKDCRNGRLDILGRGVHGFLQHNLGQVLTPAKQPLRLPWRQANIGNPGIGGMLRINGQMQGTPQLFIRSNLAPRGTIGK
mgnify:CR=1 FL=1